jgi:hypothetical protein
MGRALFQHLHQEHPFTDAEVERVTYINLDAQGTVENRVYQYAICILLHTSLALILREVTSIYGSMRPALTGHRRCAVLMQSSLQRM